MGDTGKDLKHMRESVILLGVKGKQIVVRYIQEKNHRAFKTICTQKDTTMTDVLNMFINRVIDSNGDLIDEMKAQETKELPFGR